MYLQACTGKLLLIIVSCFIGIDILSTLYLSMEVRGASTSSTHKRAIGVRDMVGWRRLWGFLAMAMMITCTCASSDPPRTTNDIAALIEQHRERILHHVSVFNSLTRSQLSAGLRNYKALSLIEERESSQSGGRCLEERKLIKTLLQRERTTSKRDASYAAVDMATARRLHIQGSGSSSSERIRTGKLHDLLLSPQGPLGDSQGEVATSELTKASEEEQVAQSNALVQSKGRASADVGESTAGHCSAVFASALSCAHSRDIGESKTSSSGSCCTLSHALKTLQEATSSNNAEFASLKAEETKLKESLIKGAAAGAAADARVEPGQSTFSITEEAIVNMRSNPQFGKAMQKCATAGGRWAYPQDTSRYMYYKYCQVMKKENRNDPIGMCSDEGKVKSTGRGLGPAACLPNVNMTSNDGALDQGVNMAGIGFGPREYTANHASSGVCKYKGSQCLPGCFDGVRIDRYPVAGLRAVTRTVSRQFSIFLQVVLFAVCGRVTPPGCPWPEVGYDPAKDLTKAQRDSVPDCRKTEPLGEGCYPMAAVYPILHNLTTAHCR